MEQVSTVMSASRSPNFLAISNSVFPHMKIGGVYSTTGSVYMDHGVTQDSGNSGDISSSNCGSSDFSGTMTY